MKRFIKNYRNRTMYNEETWQKQFHQQELEDFLKDFDNTTELLQVSGLYLTIYTRATNKHVRDSSIVTRNLKEFYDTNLGVDNNKIECVFPNCPNKLKPFVFISWIPAKYRKSHNDRSYVLSVCSYHNTLLNIKVKKSNEEGQELLSNYVEKYVLPYRERFDTETKAIEEEGLIA